MLDRTYRKHIRNSEFLKDNSKHVYLARLDVIQNDIWLNCSSQTKIGNGKCLNYIINHPEAFIEKLDEYVNKTKGRLSPKLSMHAKDGYVSAIGAIFRHTPGMIQKKAELYKKWMDIFKIVRNPINQKYNSNKPNKRQEEGSLPFHEIVKIRESLKSGSIERLVLSMYTLIPPVRSDYDKLAIYKNEKLITNENGNYLIMNNNPFIILKKYKTSKTYKDIRIDLPNKLVIEIKKSLENNPRDFLFVSPRTNKAFELPNSFNRWINRLLKSIFNKNKMKLSNLRNIYISRRDLKLEEKSGLERNEIAKIMGHSVGTQQNYLWHTYENEKSLRTEE
jgi:hypothetical protein